MRYASWRLKKRVRCWFSVEPSVGSKESQRRFKETAHFTPGAL